MRYVYLLPFLILITVPAFAQTDNSSFPQIAPNSGQIKDFTHTLVNKLDSGIGNDSQLAGIGNQGLKASDSFVALGSAVKYIIGAIVGYAGPMILGHQLPNWAVPLIMWSFIALMVIGVLKHLGKILFVGAIIGCILIIVLYLGGTVIPH